MQTRDYLGEFEQLVLLAVLRTSPAAYGVPILRELEARGGREVSRGAVYVTLERLEGKGFLTSKMGDPTAERGGRAKRYFELTPVGLAALRDSRAVLLAMWQGYEPILERS